MKGLNVSSNNIVRIDGVENPLVIDFVKHSLKFGLAGLDFEAPALEQASRTKVNVTRKPCVFSNGFEAEGRRTNSHYAKTLGVLERI